MNSFNQGVIYITDSVYNTVPHSFIFDCLERHSRCDWGDVSFAGEILNFASIATNANPICSIYHTEDNIEVNVLTFPDKSNTIVFLTSEVPLD